MDKIFLIGMGIGIFSRVIMLNTDKNQYPSQPNTMLSQLVLAFVASALGALLVPALVERSYTSITFLSLGAEQFRQVRANRRNVLQNLEEIQLVKRGGALIEEIARTYEIRNYACIVTSFLTVGIFYIMQEEFKVNENLAVGIASAIGIFIALLLKKILTRKCVADIADVVEVEISFNDTSIMQIGELKGITNIGSESDRKRFLEKGIGIEIIPKDNNYANAGTLFDMGQRQSIVYNIYSRMGILREDNEPAFVPLPRRNPNKESIMLAYIPIEKDAKQVIEAVKSAPILASAKGKNLSLSKYKISQQ